MPRDDAYPHTVPSPEQVMRARMGGLAKWANCDDRRAATAPARKALHDKFEAEVDPDGKLDPATRAAKADAARRLYYQRLSYQAAKARKANAAKRNANRRKSGGETA
jgi:hypothetical protein